MNRHTQEKRHACEICGKCFFTKYHLISHRSKIHKEIETKHANANGDGNGNDDDGDFNILNDDEFAKIIDDDDIMNFFMKFSK